MAASFFIPIRQSVPFFAKGMTKCDHVCRFGFQVSTRSISPSVHTTFEAHTMYIVESLIGISWNVSHCSRFNHFKFNLTKLDHASHRFRLHILWSIFGETFVNLAYRVILPNQTQHAVPRTAGYSSAPVLKSTCRLGTIFRGSCSSVFKSVAGSHTPIFICMDVLAYFICTTFNLDESKREQMKHSNGSLITHAITVLTVCLIWLNVQSIPDPTPHDYSCDATPHY